MFNKSSDQKSPPLGEFLPCIGKIPRYYNPREPDYYDVEVAEYLSLIGDSPLAYRDYGIVPKRYGQSRVALQRYNRPGSVYSNEIKQLYKIAGSWLDKTYGPYLSNSRVLSYNEILSRQKSDTSPGLPWSAQYPTKADYHVSEDGNFFAKYWSVLHTPDYIRSLCSVTEKEEMRLQSKIDIKKIRTIISMDVNHVTAHMRLCSDMNDKLMANHKYHPIKLGMDMFNRGFHILNNSMHKFGEGANVIELDGVLYDGRFYEEPHAEIRDFSWRMYHPIDRTKENYDRLYNITKGLVGAPLVDVDGFVYDRQVGNPSGQGSTTPHNGFKNELDISVLYMLSVPEEMRTYEQYRSNINLCIVGDDVNIEVHPRLHHRFNPKFIRDNQEKIGMEYHFASEEFRDNSECTFLGHSFVKTYIPHLQSYLFLPCIDGHKMRCSALIYNQDQTPQMTIIRACALRLETFPNVKERVFFQNFINHLRIKYPPFPNTEWEQLWKNYKTDDELFRLYAGLQ